MSVDPVKVFGLQVSCIESSIKSVLCVASEVLWSVFWKFSVFVLLTLEDVEHIDEIAYVDWGP